MRKQITRSLLAFALLSIGTLFFPPELPGQTMQIDSATASWIEGFADFTRWPNESHNEQLTIGLINAPDVLTYLQRRAEKRTHKPALKIVETYADANFEKLDIIFVGPGKKDRWKEIFEKSHDQGILCIGAQDGFNRSGGCVELVVRKNRLRFYINHENGQKCGVTLSSKLLELALEPKR